MEKNKEIDLTKIWPTIKSDRKIVFISVGLGVLLAIIYCIFATPIYTAKILINPPKLSDAGSGIYNPLTSFTNFSGSYMQKTDAEVCKALLSTQSVSDMIIKKFDLVKLYKSNDIDKISYGLRGSTEFGLNVKNGFVEINFSDKSPKLAADIANYYVVALGQLISSIALSGVAQKVNFFEEQTPLAKKSLDKASDNLKKFALKHGVLASQQSQVIIGLSTQFQSQLVIAQSQLQSMTAYATVDNPEYKKLQIQITAIKAQLSNLNNGHPSPSNEDKVAIPVGLAPEYNQQWLNLSRELAIRENIYRLLQQQYEAAKLDELSDVVPASVQVVDYARVPTHKSKPKRLFIILEAFIGSGFLALLYVLLKNRKLYIVSN